MDPWTIVVALACVVLGAPDALRLLLDFAGRKGPVADIAICAIVIGTVTSHLLGVALLARFLRKAPWAQYGAAGGGETPRPPRAPATDLFAKITLVVSVGIAFLATACLVVLQGGGLMSTAQLVFDIAGKSPVATAVVNGAAGSLPFILPLLHVLRQARDASGSAAATRVMECLAGMARQAPWLVPGLSLIVGTVLLLFNLLAGAVPAPATGAERVGKLRQNAFLVGLVCIAITSVVSLILQYAYAPPAYKSDGGEHVCSA